MSVGWFFVNWWIRRCLRLFLHDFNRWVDWRIEFYFLAIWPWFKRIVEKNWMISDSKTSFLTGWWFGTFFIFPYIGNNHPNWLIFFRGVQTTNQLIFGLVPHSCTIPTWMEESDLLIFKSDVMMSCEGYILTICPFASNSDVFSTEISILQSQGVCLCQQPAWTGEWLAFQSAGNLLLSRLGLS